MFETLKAPFPTDIATLLARIGYRKKTVFFVPNGKAGDPVALRSYWDSGSRDHFAAFDKYGAEIKLSVGGAPVFTPEPLPNVFKAGDVLIRYGVCMGKTATATVTRFV